MLIRKPLKKDELLERLKRFSIKIIKKRGKGSELILLQPSEPGSKKGEIFTIKDHGKKTEYPIQVVNAVLRRFQISPEDFWN
jgi:hypothetical protein